MGRLLNTFSWSFSRHNTFQECQKKYWYTYYGSWDGWPKTPYDTRKSIDPLAATLYTLKQIQHLPMYIGSVVHKTIEDLLQKGMQPIEEDIEKKLIEHALHSFRKGIVDSEKKAWEGAPKKYPNLFEHYYGKESILESSLQVNEEKIRVSLENWSRSNIVQKLAFGKSARWVSVEKLDHFMLFSSDLQKQYKILVVIDFAMQWQPQGKEPIFILFDWKTGKQTEKTDEQLLSYALFAHKSWKVPYERIILSPFYLVDNVYTKIGCNQEKELSADALKRAEDTIVASCEAMVTPLNGNLDALKEPLDPRLFPYTEARGKCTQCPFQAICKGVEFKEASIEELRTRAYEIGVVPKYTA